jgi:hypothetical protein
MKLELPEWLIAKNGWRSLPVLLPENEEAA